MKDIYRILDTLGITYIKHDHPPLFTVAEANEYHETIAGAHTKNLFLRNKKGNTHYLVVVESSKRVDLQALRKVLQEAKLSFASSERLKQYLNLTPGSVTPFGLINDEEKAIRVVIDQDLWEQDQLNFHPNINTATLTVQKKDFRKFLEWTGNGVRSLEIPQQV